MRSVIASPAAVLAATVLPATVLLGFAATAVAGDFALTSPSLADRGRLPKAQVYDQLGCKGDNVSPALSWHDVPSGTRSFAVTVYDEDARNGSGWWHWTVLNLPPDTRRLEAGAGSPNGPLPRGAVQLRNDYGGFGYGGPCPPPGDKPHHYLVTVYALKTPQVDVSAKTSADAAQRLIRHDEIGRAQLTVHFGR
jgi:Raf kinase inhibitor-like YbhB/YbcL family protein